MISSIWSWIPMLFCCSRKAKKPTCFPTILRNYFLTSLIRDLAKQISFIGSGSGNLIRPDLIFTWPELTWNLKTLDQVNLTLTWNLRALIRSGQFSGWPDIFYKANRQTLHVSKRHKAYIWCKHINTPDQFSRL